MVTIKKNFTSLIAFCTCAISPLVWSMPNSASYQRHVILHNDLPITIYPVIQSPDNNCHKDSTKVNRIVVNYEGSSGLPPGQSIKVFIPSKCWYNAGRIYLSTIPIDSFESQLHDAVHTIPSNLSDYPAELSLCTTASATNNKAVGGCYIGYAEASYPLDAPAQLVEFTFDADDPITGQPTTNPDTGIPMTDIDISYVDQAYLPVAMVVDDHGASGYLGTIMNYHEFNHKTNNFIEQGWSPFAAYSKTNWNTNKFHHLLKEQSANIPAGANLFKLINTQALSDLYTLIPPDKTPLCSAWDGCSHLSGDCCPVNGTYLACCGLSGHNYMIDNTELKQGKVSNPTFDLIANRWKMWVNPDTDPCVNIDKIKVWPSEHPDFDKLTFCTMFGRTVAYVWNYFNQHADDCGLNVEKDHCVIEKIIGYNSDVVGGMLPESVQALLRSVPYVPEGSGPQYQLDKWLLFWASSDSIFNLNPFAHYVHKEIDAIAYSFSIDDKYGNFRTKGNGFIVDIGGDEALLNKSSFDPYEQYFVAWANNWSNAKVCGNSLDINSLPGNARISLWNNGIKNEYCDVTLFTKSGEYVTFRLTEKTYQVTDSYTGISGHTVHGLTNDIDYCLNHSSSALLDICKQANLSSIEKGDIAYVSVAENDRPKVVLNLPPAP